MYVNFAQLEHIRDKMAFCKNCHIIMVAVSAAWPVNKVSVKSAEMQPLIHSLSRMCCLTSSAHILNSKYHRPPLNILKLN